jgi:hypothetical protein
MGRAARTLALALVCAGCATAVPEEVLRSQLREAASSVPGGARAVVVPIYADSRAAAWTLMAEARSGESPLSRQLGNRFVHLASRRSVVAVGSSYEPLARQVLLGALSGDDDRSLRGLTLVFVGSAESAAELRPVAEQRQARFVHRNLP